MRIIVFLLSVLAITSISLPALASDYYVDVNKGSDENTGTSPNDAWKTITFAISMVNASVDDPAYIHVAAGKYNKYSGENTSFPLKSNIKLIGIGPEATILGGHDLVQPSIKCNFVNNIELRNLALIKGHGLLSQNSTLSLFNCILEENRSGSRGGAIGSYNSTLTITNCIIRSNQAVGGDWCYGGGIYSKNSTINIVNSEIIGNSTPCQIFGYGGGIYSLDSNINFVNCLIAGNSDFGGYGGAIYAETSSMKITNCTIAYNSDNYYHNNYSRTVQLILGNYSIDNSIIFNCGYSPIISKYVYISYSDVKNGYPGEGNIDLDPNFVEGPWGYYYLSQKSAGNKYESPCVDTGSSVPPLGFDYQWRTTRIDGVFDSGRIDMGYHYPPHVKFELGIEPEKKTFTTGDSMKILLDVDTAPAESLVDIYFVMLAPDGEIYSSNSWSKGISPMITNLKIPASTEIHDTPVLEISIPKNDPPINSSGNYTFAILAVKAGTGIPISNLSTVSFIYE